MPNINELLEGHVTLEVECIDRLYLNGYLPRLATGGGLVGFLTGHLGKPIPSPALLGQITQSWVEALKCWASQHDIPLIHFQHGEHKDEVVQRLLACSGRPTDAELLSEAVVLSCRRAGMRYGNRFPSCSRSESSRQL